MTYNDPETVEKYRVPENLELESLSKYIKLILTKYNNRTLSMNDVTNYGEALEIFIFNKFGAREIGEYPHFPEEDLRSISLKVIDYMVNMDFWILPQDVPHFIDFLETPIGKEKEGQAKFEEYIRSQTLRKRITEEERQGAFRGNHVDLDKPFNPL